MEKKAKLAAALGLALVVAGGWPAQAAPIGSMAGDRPRVPGHILRSSPLAPEALTLTADALVRGQVAGVFPWYGPASQVVLERVDPVSGRVTIEMRATGLAGFARVTTAVRADVGAPSHATCQMAGKQNGGVCSFVLGKAGASLQLILAGQNNLVTVARLRYHP